MVGVRAKGETMNKHSDAHVPHPASATEAPNGAGTVSPETSGSTLDRPILDGASETYGNDPQESGEAGGDDTGA